MKNRAETGFVYFASHYLAMPRSTARSLWMALDGSTHHACVAIARGWKLSTCLGYQESAFNHLIETTMAPVRFVEALEALARERRLPRAQLYKIIEHVLLRTTAIGTWNE
jgi:hypothetical protein